MRSLARHPSAPASFPTSGGVNTARLAFPITYWNALGMFSGLGAILLTHMTASEREPAAVRVAAAAGLPIVAVALYFTFSRGGIAATIVGVVVYIVLARPRGLLGALPAVGLPLAFALQQAYGAELLAREYYTGAGAREQGRELLVVLLACVVAAAALRGLALLADRRLVRIRIGSRTRAGCSPPWGSRRYSHSWSPWSPSTFPAASMTSAGRSCAATRRRAVPICARG